MSIREQLAEQYGEELLFLDPPEDFDRCILGVVYRCGMEPVVAYDEEQVLAALVLGGMDAEEAQEWFSFNTAGAYMGPRTPMFLAKVAADSEFFA